MFLNTSMRWHIIKTENEIIVELKAVLFEFFVTFLRSFFPLWPSELESKVRLWSKTLIASFVFSLVGVKP